MTSAGKGREGRGRKMDIWEIKDIQVRFNRGELSDIAYAVLTAIKESAESHWVRHYQGDTEEGFADYVLKQNESRARFIKMAFEVCQYYNWDSVIYELKQIWKDWCAKQAVKK
jgi:hypothetical protein